MVLIRALGPSLTAFGVNPARANPKMQLFQVSTQLKENDDWQTNANVADILGTSLARLEPGPYTTVVFGADGGNGIALVEVSQIERD